MPNNKKNVFLDPKKDGEFLFLARHGITSLSCVKELKEVAETMSFGNPFLDFCCWF